MFAAAGVEKVQAGLQRMRVLHVLRGLLLTREAFVVRVKKTALRKIPKADMLCDSGLVAAGFV
jgi:hypothetical protein